ncbi:MAG: RsmG family class I SAM-dependent methyltransferase, partial [Mariprofundaceae bacterium]
MEGWLEGRIRELGQRWIDEVMRFRRALNLTSVDDPSAFRERFLLPSLAMAAWLPDRGRLLDVGSGMGVPGIPLLIAKPGIFGILVERRLKRAEFLRHLVRTLGLDAEVMADDVNRIPRLEVDVCVARAVADQA